MGRRQGGLREGQPPPPPRCTTPALRRRLLSGPLTGSTRHDETRRGASPEREERGARGGRRGPVLRADCLPGDLFPPRRAAPVARLPAWYLSLAPAGRGRNPWPVRARAGIRGPGRRAARVAPPAPRARRARPPPAPRSSRGAARRARRGPRYPFTSPATCDQRKTTDVDHSQRTGPSAPSHPAPPRARVPHAHPNAHRDTHTDHAHGPAPHQTSEPRQPASDEGDRPDRETHAKSDDTGREEARGSRRTRAQGPGGRDMFTGGQPPTRHPATERP